MGLTSHKQGLSVLGALGWLVPKGLHVMRGPLGLTKITRHVLLKVSWSLGKHKILNYRPRWELNNHKQIKLMKNGNMLWSIASGRECL